MNEIYSLAKDRDKAITRAAQAARSGLLIVFPTDTVYGIGADAFQPFATSMLFTVKGRPRSLPLPVMVAAPRQAWALTSNVSRAAAALVEEFWPGALTIVVKQADGLEWDLGDTNGTIALRVPSNAEARDLIAQVGPMAVTSANLTGEPTAPAVEEIAQKFGGVVGVYLDGGEAPSEVPSTIVDLTGRKPKIKREGAIPRAEIERVVGSPVG